MLECGRSGELRLVVEVSVLYPCEQRAGIRGNRSSPHMCLQERDLVLSKNEFIQADIFHIHDVPWT